MAQACVPVPGGGIQELALVLCSCLGRQALVVPVSLVEECGLPVCGVGVPDLMILAAARASTLENVSFFLGH